jgi:hypothetical protein
MKKRTTDSAIQAATSAITPTTTRLIVFARDRGGALGFSPRGSSLSRRRPGSPDSGRMRSRRRLRER